MAVKQGILSRTRLCEKLKGCEVKSRAEWAVQEKVEVAVIILAVAGISNLI